MRMRDSFPLPSYLADSHRVSAAGGKELESATKDTAGLYVKSERTSCIRLATPLVISSIR